ncbi:MAG: Nudix family hydrolase [Chromatiaceae bacterium]|jgi:8-oxo-dGTP diphosphatase
MRVIHVAAGAIKDRLGRVLVTRRASHVHQGGLWEFPGGKLEPGEDVTQALRRELDEELGVQVLAFRPLIRVPHDYGDRRVLLYVYLVTAYAGEPRSREGQPLGWWYPNEMDPSVFPDADRPIISALRLPELYLITGPDPRRPDAFVRQLEQALERGIRLVQLRAHELADTDYASLAFRAFALCEGSGARLMVSTDPCRAQDLPCHGLHLSGERLRGLDRRPFTDQRWVGASCHGAEDLALAQRWGLDYALLSPVRLTATHPEAVPLGWEGFAALADAAAIPIFALGGLRPEDLPEAVQRGAQGVAAIRGLWPEAPPSS